MINIDFQRKGDNVRLRIEGHAGYSEHGGDIVCASVSSIFYAICAYFYNFKRDSIRVNEIQRGLADIECGSDGEELLKLACLGLWQIACEFPGYVRVNIGAWNWLMKPSSVRYMNITPFGGKG